MTHNEWRITHHHCLEELTIFFFLSSHDLTWRRRLIHGTDSARREQIMSIIRHNFLILIRFRFVKQKESADDCRADGVVRKNVRTTAKMISKCKNVRAKFFLQISVVKRECSKNVSFIWAGSGFVRNKDKRDPMVNLVSIIFFYFRASIYLLKLTTTAGPKFTFK